MAPSYSATPFPHKRAKIVALWIHNTQFLAYRHCVSAQTAIWNLLVNRLVSSFASVTPMSCSGWKTRLSEYVSALFWRFLWCEFAKSNVSCAFDVKTSPSILATMTSCRVKIFLSIFVLVKRTTRIIWLRVRGNGFRSKTDPANLAFAAATSISYNRGITPVGIRLFSDFAISCVRMRMHINSQLVTWEWVSA